MRSLVIGTLMICFTMTACVFVPRSMWRAAEQNRQHLNLVHVGQSLAEVRGIMGKDAERREVRKRFDGKTVEMWSFVSDYGRKMDTTIVFVGGEVEELRTGSWGEKD